MLDGIVKECLDESPLLRPDARDAMERLEQEQRNCWNPTDQIYAKAELKMLTVCITITNYLCETIIMAKLQVKDTSQRKDLHSAATTR